MKRKLLRDALLALSCSLVSASSLALAEGGGLAPQGPGFPEDKRFGAGSVWASSMKQGIGTSYEKYNPALTAFGHPDTGPLSKVWFSLAEGIVTETAFGLIHEAQLKDLQFLITGSEGGGFFDEERVDTTHSVTYLHTDTGTAQGRPLSPAYRIVNEDKEGKYRIEKHVFTDPSRQTLFMRVIFTAMEDGITPYLLVNPHIANTGVQDVAFVGTPAGGTPHLGARNRADDTYLLVKSSAPFVKTSAGYVGVNDGWSDLAADRFMDFEYDYTEANLPDGKGNVALTAQFPTVDSATVTFDVVVGFGDSFLEAEANALGSLGEGYDSVRDRYNGVGALVGWEDYIGGLSEIGSLVSASGDDGRLLHASALAIKVMEDKTNAGALIACLCVPWGESTSADVFATGYRAVWVRDFFQVGMAFLALGDAETAKVAFNYLPRVQVTASTPGVGPGNDPGWFLQKTLVDGTLEWIRLQKDQTAMPIMYAWKLWQAGVLSDAEIAAAYWGMLKPAAEFLSNTRSVDLTLGADRYAETYTPAETEQERWEEEKGRSPSTNAAVIAGLIAAADIADWIGGSEVGAADYYRAQADILVLGLDQMFTTSGFLGDGQYFIRIGDNDDPNDTPAGAHQVCINNGGPCVSERAILDGGFLELVRYGVLAANDSRILETLDDYNLKGPAIAEHDQVRYDFGFGGTPFPAWRRYSQDHYGERVADGADFSGDDPDNRGRPWPFLTGEYGTYELDRLKENAGGAVSPAQITQLRETYARAMERFANDSLMLPEQIWDGVSAVPVDRFSLGEGTNSATPLAWPHAEYIKLLRSYRDAANFSRFPVVADRYLSASP